MATTTFNPRVVNSSGDNNTTISMPLREDAGDSEGSVWSWLIPVLGAAAVAVFNNWQEGRRAKQQQEFSEKMYQQQVADNLNFWNLNNAYNSASAQKQRLSEAGLSSLYYGLQNGQAPAEGGQPLGYQRADYSIQNPLLEASQISNIQADTAKKSEERLNLVKERDQMQANIDKAKAEIIEIGTRSDVNKATKAQIDKVVQWYDRVQESLIDYQGSASKLNKEQANKIKTLLPYEEVIHIKNIEEFEKKWEMWKAQARKDNALADLSEKDLEYYMWNHMQNGIFGSGISMINFLKMLSGVDDWLKLPENQPKKPDSIPFPQGDGYGSPYPPLSH